MAVHHFDDNALFLKNTNPFGDLGCGAVRKLGEIVVEKRFEVGTNIFSANEKAEYIYMIREGRVKLFRTTEDGRENIVSLLGPGDIFGEFIFGKDQTHSVYAQAFEPSWLCILTRSGFFKLLIADTQIAVTIVSNIGRRLAAHACSIENLSTYAVDLRFGKLLSSLASEFSSSSPSKTGAGIVELTVNLTHQDMANMIAMCRQTVTSIVNRFKLAGILRYRGKTLIVNMPLLMEYLAQHGAGTVNQGYKQKDTNNKLQRLRDVATTTVAVEK